MTIEFPPRPEDRHELARRITLQAESLERLLAPLEEARMLAPLGDWSVKDHLAHLAAWQGKALAALQGGPVYERMSLERPPDDPRDFEAINALLHARWQHAPLAEVRAWLHDARQQVLAALATSGDADLRQPFAANDPDGATIMEVVCANTYEHYLEHETWLKQKLDAAA